MSYLRFLRNHVGHAKIIINCSAVWIENTNGILLERRSDDGNWGLIGGVMELDESPSETAIRETLEETGMPATIDHLIGVYSKHQHEYPNGDKAQALVFFFHVNVDPKIHPQASHESMELAYFKREDLPELGMKQHQVMMCDALSNTKNKIQ